MSPKSVDHLKAPAESWMGRIVQFVRGALDNVFRHPGQSAAAALMLTSVLGGRPARADEFDFNTTAPTKSAPLPAKPAAAPTPAAPAVAPATGAATPAATPVATSTPAATSTTGTATPGTTRTRTRTRTAPAAATPPTGTAAPVTAPAAPGAPTGTPAPTGTTTPAVPAGTPAAAAPAGGAEVKPKSPLFADLLKVLGGAVAAAAVLEAWRRLRRKDAKSLLKALDGLDLGELTPKQRADLARIAEGWAAQASALAGDEEPEAPDAGSGEEDGDEE